MPKYKSLVNYKIGYKPDAPKKTKNIEIEDNGATTTYAIPVVSGDKDIEFQVQEQLPIFFSLANQRGYNGLDKFTHFGECLSGPFKSTWENELNANFAANHLRTNPGFRRALIGTWVRFYGQPDLRKAGLKYVSKLKWKDMYHKYSHTPVQFTQRVETLYAVLKQLDEDPGTTPMPTARQKKEYLVESFPKDYQEYYELRGGDYTESMAQIGQCMEDHFDRENESSSNDESISSSDDSSDSDDSSNSESSTDSDTDRKRKRKKSKHAKRHNKKRHQSKSKKTSKKHSKKKSSKPHTSNKSSRFVGPDFNDVCPLHGGHIWGNCRLNRRGANYDPPKPYQSYFRRDGSSNAGQKPQFQQGRGRGANPQQTQHGTGQQSYLIAADSTSTERANSSPPADLLAPYRPGILKKYPDLSSYHPANLRG